MGQLPILAARRSEFCLDCLDRRRCADSPWLVAGHLADRCGYVVGRAVDRLSHRVIRILEFAGDLRPGQPLQHLWCEERTCYYGLVAEVDERVARALRRAPVFHP